MFARNTKQINQLIANILAGSSAAIGVMVLLSAAGFFEFGRKYTLLVLIAGLFVTITPKLFIRFMPDKFMKYYMLVSTSVFIGVIGTDRHVGIYITYILIPIMSCLYFEPRFICEMGVFSYVTMVVSLYFCSPTMNEVLYLGRPRMQMFLAYTIGFTIEYIVAFAVLLYLVKRAKKMMLERYSAEEQNKMKSMFLSNMSHEIRTPMNAIIGMSDVALQSEMDDKLRNYITIINSSATGLLDIINEILDISKIEAGRLEIISQPYSTKSLIDDMIAIIDARNDSDVPIYYQIPGKLPEMLEGDSGRIKQVMLNYASNAIKYTDSGRIDVSVSFDETKDGVDLEFTVTDTGQGIHSEDMDKLFTMYGQLNRDLNSGKEGTGIGLALSKSFIEQMGGTVSAESEYGKGSKFSFRVPQKVVETAKHEEKKNSRAESLFTTSGVKILIVDDNEINREVAIAMLEPFEMQTDEAKDGREAVEMAAETDYDIILMDRHMPVMNGEDATRAIRENEGEGRHVPIIALTADAIAGVRETLLAAGMDDYIVKPIDFVVLSGVLKKYLPKDKVRP